MVSVKSVSDYRYDINSLKKHGRSFYWASFFLPRKNKQIAGELYSICRYFDDLADSSSENLTEEIKTEYHKIISNESNEINKFFSKNNIRIAILGDLVNGLIKDQVEVRIDTETELIEYAYEVAGTVGLMMLPIILTDNPEARKHAIDLGIAMQLTNIARDIYEDAKMDRLYLPNEWIGDITIENLVNIEKIEPLKVKTVIKRLIQLSNIFYKNGFSGLKYIPFKTRLAIFISAQVYKGIGEKIKKNHYRYDLKRIYVNNFEKLWITLVSIPKFFLIKYIYKNYTPVRNTFRNENL